jgi:hypothetical protein
MSLIVSSYYDSRVGKSGTTLTPEQPGMTVEAVREHIDFKCPVEFRTVNGVDTLYIVEIDADLVIHTINTGRVEEHLK